MKIPPMCAAGAPTCPSFHVRHGPGVAASLRDVDLQEPVAIDATMRADRVLREGEMQVVVAARTVDDYRDRVAHSVASPPRATGATTSTRSLAKVSRSSCRERV